MYHNVNKINKKIEEDSFKNNYIIDNEYNNIIISKNINDEKKDEYNNIINLNYKKNDEPYNNIINLNDEKKDELKNEMFSKENGNLLDNDNKIKQQYCEQILKLRAENDKMNYLLEKERNEKNKFIQLLKNPENNLIKSKQ